MKENMNKRITLKKSMLQESASKENSSKVTFEIDPLEIGRTLLRRRKWFVWIVSSTVIATIAIMLMTSNRYTSHAVILPSGKSSGGMSALKAMAGLVGGMGAGDETSSNLFPVILQSHLVADSLLGHVYNFELYNHDTTMTLREYIGKDDTDKLYHSLSGMTEISTDTRTGEITVAVETKSPEFSRLLVSEYIAQLENYNLHSRKSKATERVSYLQRELKSRLDSLTQSENNLSDFQNGNRNWAMTTNPFILKQLGRFKREVEIKTTTYAYLLQEYEIARLDAQKDIPIVRILDRATFPTQKTGPNRTVAVLVSAFISFFGVLFLVIVIELIQTGIRLSDKNTVDALRNELLDANPFTRRSNTTTNEILERT